MSRIPVVYGNERIHRNLPDAQINNMPQWDTNQRESRQAKNNGVKGFYDFYTEQGIADTYFQIIGTAVQDGLR